MVEGFGEGANGITVIDGTVVDFDGKLLGTMEEDVLDFDGGKVGIA